MLKIRHFIYLNVIGMFVEVKVERDAMIEGAMKKNCIDGTG